MEELNIRRNPILSTSSLLSTRNNLLASSTLTNSLISKSAPAEEKQLAPKRHLPVSLEISSKKPNVQALSYGKSSSLSKSLYGSLTSKNLADGKSSILSSTNSKSLSYNLKSQNNLSGIKSTSKWTFQTDTDSRTGITAQAYSSIIKQDQGKSQQQIEPSTRFPEYPELKIQDDGLKLSNSNFRNLDSNERKTAAELINEKVIFFCLMFRNPICAFT